MTESDEFSRESFFSMVEKAVNPQFFLLTTSFVLFVDWALVYFCGFGARDVAGGSPPVSIALAMKITLAFLAFSGLTSLVVPFAMVPVMLLYIEVQYRGSALIYELNRRLFGSNEPWVAKLREYNHVRPNELELEAHETQSDFLIRLYESDSRREARERAQTRKTQLYALCALVFMLLNYWITGAAVCHTVTCWTVDYFGSNVPIWLGFTLFAILAFGPLHTNDWDRRWIFHPPLYRKLEHEDEERRKRQQEWKEAVTQPARKGRGRASNSTSRS